MLEKYASSYEEPKRPSAAFFVPENLQTIDDWRQFSQSFNAHYQDLLPLKTGLISQTVTVKDHVEGPPTETLLFDAQQQFENIYSWQITSTYAVNKGRTIRQIYFSAEGYEGQLFKLNGQGSLEQQHILTDAELPQLLNDIHRILEVAGGMELQAETRRTQKLMFKIKLDELATRPFKDEEKYAQLEARYKQFGFAALSLYEPPLKKMGAESFKKPERRRPFNNNSRQYEPRLPLPGELAFRRLRILKPNLPEAEVIAKLAAITDKCATLNQRPDKELSAKEAVSKTLAYAELNRILRPLLYGARNTVFPKNNKTYGVGQHFYHHDRSGIYVVGKNPWSKVSYLLLKSFKQPARYNFAGQQAWVELAEDLIAVSQANSKRD